MLNTLALLVHSCVLLPCLFDLTTMVMAVLLATEASPLTVTHRASISISKDPSNIRILYRYYPPKSRELVFVATMNSIYQFEAQSLEPIATHVTGPKNFSIFCFPEQNDCSKCMPSVPSSLPMGYTSNYCGPRLTDNYVKAWGTSTVSEEEVGEHFAEFPTYDASAKVVNDDRVARENALYVCYNVFHGYCERLLLTNITQANPWHLPGQSAAPSNIPVVGCDPTTHAVLVLSSEYVYVAVESDGLESITLNPLYSLSARFRNFEIVHKEPHPDSYLRQTEGPNFRIQYKFAFRYRQNVSEGDYRMLIEPYVYFVFQQPENAHFYRWQPRIARICERDKYFYSYIELNLMCTNCTWKEEHKVSDCVWGRELSILM